MSELMSKRVFVQQLALHLLSAANVNNIATKGRFTVSEVIKAANDIEDNHPDFFPDTPQLAEPVILPSSEEQS